MRETYVVVADTLEWYNSYYTPESKLVDNKTLAQCLAQSSVSPKEIVKVIKKAADIGFLNQLFDPDLDPDTGREVLQKLKRATR